MKLYEIQLPARDNSNESTYSALRRFENALLDIAGGYTDCGKAGGLWADGPKIYRDTVILYHVACEPEQFNRILTAAFKLFPDQLAIFTAVIGEATIHSRPQTFTGLDKEAHPL